MDVASGSNNVTGRLIGGKYVNCRKSDKSRSVGLQSGT